MPERDALLEFDPERRSVAASGSSYKRNGVRAAYEVYATKQSNRQLAIGVQFSYARSTRVHDAGFASAVAEAWSAMEPLLERLQASSDVEAGIGARRRRCAA